MSRRDDVMGLYRPSEILEKIEKVFFALILLPLWLHWYLMKP